MSFLSEIAILEIRVFQHCAGRQGDLMTGESMEEQRLIFHIDVNSAFLSWTAVKRLQEDPSSVDLRTIPSAVGGDRKTRHGIITAKSIPARKYGVTTGEPVVKALQKCPNLVLVEGDFETYRKYSHAFIEILHRYAPVVEQVSIDEAFLDLTGTENMYAQLATPSQPFPVCLAEKIKDEIRDTLGFTVNVGISTNKLLAKMASDFTKPDRIHTLYPEEVPQKMWPLEIGELYGCGKSTAQRLKSLGIRTIGDAAQMKEETLQSMLGEKGGTYIFQSANGISTSRVSGETEEAKGYSNETTTMQDITTENYVAEATPSLRWLSEKVAERLRRDGVYAQTIGVSVKTDDFKRHSRQTTLKESVSRTDLIFHTAVELLNQLMLGADGLFIKGSHIRLIGVSATNLDHGEYRQMNLFDLAPQQDKAMPETPGTKPVSVEKEQRLDAMTDKIRSEFGKNAIRRGSELEHQQR